MKEEGWKQRKKKKRKQEKLDVSGERYDKRARTKAVTEVRMACMAASSRLRGYDVIVDGT